MKLSHHPFPFDQHGPGRTVSPKRCCTCRDVVDRRCGGSSVYASVASPQAAVFAARPQKYLFKVAAR
jgi:hypothetical protein